MKLKYIFEAVNMGDEIVCVPVGERADEVQGVLKLNKEGQEILELLKEDTTETEIVVALAAKYENDHAVLTDYVRNMVEKLRTAGLIAE